MSSDLSKLKDHIKIGDMVNYKRFGTNERKKRKKGVKYGDISRCDRAYKICDDSKRISKSTDNS